MIAFPPVERADAYGLLCTSDTIDAELIWSAYRQGIFPWTDLPVGWFAPAKRGVLWPSEAHFPRNLPKLWRKGRFVATCDQDFAAVINGCRAAHEGAGEWLTPRFVAAYEDLSAKGHAHSVEIWQDGRLVGGTYGVQVGRLFAAESMFGLVDNASRAAIYALVQAMPSLLLELLDVQVVTEATAALGARSIERRDFMRLLGACMRGHQEGLPLWPEVLTQPWERSARA